MRPAQQRPVSQTYAAPAARPQPQPIYPAIPPEMQNMQPDVVDQVGRSDELDRVGKERTKKAPLPKLFIAIVAVSFIALALGFIDNSQNGTVYTALAGLFALLMVVMLFVRKDILRKIALGTAVVTATACAALVFSYRGFESSTVKAEAMFIEEAKRLQNQSPTKQLTKEQQSHLDAMQFKLEAQQAGVNSNSLIVYGKYGFAILAFAGIAVYLTRPKVKEAFQPID
jgi:hypothetical protein